MLVTLSPGKFSVAMNSDLHISVHSMVVPIYSLPVNEAAVVHSRA